MQRRVKEGEIESNKEIEEAFQEINKAQKRYVFFRASHREEMQKDWDLYLNWLNNRPGPESGIMLERQGLDRTEAMDAEYVSNLKCILDLE